MHSFIVLLRKRLHLIHRKQKESFRPPGIRSWSPSSLQSELQIRSFRCCSLCCLIYLLSGDNTPTRASHVYWFQLVRYQCNYFCKFMWHDRKDTFRLFWYCSKRLVCFVSSNQEFGIHRNLYVYLRKHWQVVFPSWLVRNPQPSSIRHVLWLLDFPRHEVRNIKWNQELRSSWSYHGLPSYLWHLPRQRNCLNLSGMTN